MFRRFVRQVLVPELAATLPSNLEEGCQETHLPYIGACFSKFSITFPTLFEDEEQPAVDIRTELLPSLRELGPPDLVHLIKQSTKSSSRQVRCQIALLFLTCRWYMASLAYTIMSPVLMLHHLPVWQHMLIPSSTHRATRHTGWLQAYIGALHTKRTDVSNLP